MRYQCHPGYTMSGADTLTCRLSAQLQFEGTVPTCEGRCHPTLPGPGGSELPLPWASARRDSEHPPAELARESQPRRRGRPAFIPMV